MNDFYNFENKIFVVIKPGFTSLSPTIIIKKMIYSL